MRPALVGRQFAQSPQLHANITVAAEGLLALLEKYRNVLDDPFQRVQQRQRDELIDDFNGALAPTLLSESGELLRKAHDAHDPHAGCRDGILR
ncbi:MAG TPA: hypothetical protein VFN13_05950 [Rudaea sp.]|nr:hypothetical protein [Rudaea sp.]